ncbi:MAG: T9SS type A sorting domain-containing protein [Paludibacteraceae bacterium]|nr:T9SS type A sorting domain-containing protein [Paludibacteraceae bacterium]MBN2787672.1 T9SS type A sorting domain-containing protein [Paludibacteraceae bacterium]
MKKPPVILVLLIVISINAYAQIPNSGFEDWTGTVEYPTSWLNCNMAGGPTYPVSKSTDHYPTDVGSFSVKMETNFVQAQQLNCAHGFIKTGQYLGDFGPGFAIVGHPNSLCGYYKFLPENNDTMIISINLFLAGTIVASGSLTSTSTVSDWTPFNIPISSYITADSAEIGFSAYYSVYGQMPTGPWGNSVMYVDNINFDNLITSVSEMKSDNATYSLYPNPASNNVTVDINTTNKIDLTLNIYSVTGKLITSYSFLQDKYQMDVSNLENGIYFVEIISNQWKKSQKLIIQR